MNKKFLIIAPLIGLSFVSGCKPADQGHEHAFSSEWTITDDLHYHASTCEHKGLAKDLSAHTYVNGICSACGHVDPNYVPEPVPYVNKYYLPLKVSETLDGEFSEETTFEYSDDLLSFSSHRKYVVDGPDYYVTDKTYTFSADYKSLDVNMVNYHYVDEVPSKEDDVILKYKFYDNNSQTCERRDWNEETKAYEHSYEIGTFYNDKNQEIFAYWISKDEEHDGVYFDSIYQMEYNDDGLITKKTCWESDDGVLTLDYWDEYEYSNNNLSYIERTYRSTEYGYREQGRYEVTGKIEDGIRYEDELVYNEEGVNTNHNKYSYFLDGTQKSYEYGDGVEIFFEGKIERNEFGQITLYYDTANKLPRDMTFSYEPNGGNLISANKKSGEKTMMSSFTYTASNQLLQAKELNITEEHELQIDFTYTTLQNDCLLEWMDVFENTIRNYADDVLVYGLI